LFAFQVDRWYKITKEHHKELSQNQDWADMVAIFNSIDAEYGVPPPLFSFDTSIH